MMSRPRRSETIVHLLLTLLADCYDMAGAIIYGHRPDSDADVAVLLKGEHQRVLPTTLAMASVAYDVLLETGINISPPARLARRMGAPGDLLEPGPAPQHRQGRSTAVKAKNLMAKAVQAAASAQLLYAASSAA